MAFYTRKGVNGFLYMIKQCSNWFETGTQDSLFPVVLVPVPHPVAVSLPVYHVETWSNSLVPFPYMDMLQDFLWEIQEIFMKNSVTLPHKVKGLMYMGREELMGTQYQLIS